MHAIDPCATSLMLILSPGQLLIDLSSTSEIIPLPSRSPRGDVEELFAVAIGADNIEPVLRVSFEWYVVDRHNNYNNKGSEISHQNDIWSAFFFGFRW